VLLVACKGAIGPASRVPEMGKMFFYHGESGSGASLGASSAACLTGKCILERECGCQLLKRHLRSEAFSRPTALRDGSRSLRVCAE
jgi:hypothetical protein